MRERVLDGYLAAVWITILAASALSSLELLHAIGGWACAAAATAVVIRAIPAAKPDEAARSSSVLPGASRSVLLVLIASAAIAVVCNLVLIAGTAPASWDALSYHLPRLALSLQRHSFDVGPVNFWAQQAHPIGGTALLAAASVLSGHSERALAIWQMAGWAVAAVSVYAIARDTGSSSNESLSAALLFGLLPQAIVQAPTAGNDMVLAALTGIAVQALLAYLAHGHGRDAVRLTLACGAGFAIKLSFVCQLAMLIALAALVVVARRRFRAAPAVAAAVGIAIAIAAPFGYIANVRRWGTIVGPPAAVTAHTFAAEATGDRIASGTINIVRLATDFVSLDGLPRVEPVLRAQSMLRHGVAALIAPAGSPIASTRGTRAGFLVDRPAFAAETHSFWGLAGMVLLWPAAIVALVRGSPERRALAGSAFVFLLAQAFSGPYDPFRGRYFLSAAIVVAPLAGEWLTHRSGVARTYGLMCVLLTALTALGASVFRTGAPLVAAQARGAEYASILSRDRAAQLTRQRPVYAEAVRHYEELVPSDAIVADMLPPDAFEYVLWGPRLERTILPVGNRSPMDPTFSRAQFLVFSPDRLPPVAGDVLLGADWWLRRLR